MNDFTKLTKKLLLFFIAGFILTGFAHWGWDFVKGHKDVDIIGETKWAVQEDVTWCETFYDGSMCRGGFANDSVSASIEAKKWVEWSTCYTWMGWLVPEKWNEEQQGWTEKEELACYSDNNRNTRVSLCEPGIYRLRMKYFKEGYCGYSIAGI